MLRGTKKSVFISKLNVKLLKALLTPTHGGGHRGGKAIKLRAINFPDIFISITAQRCLLAFLTGNSVFVLCLSSGNNGLLTEPHLKAKLKPWKMDTAK